MTGTGRAIVSTPAMAHKDPTIFPHTPTGLHHRIVHRKHEREKDRERTVRTGVIRVLTSRDKNRLSVQDDLFFSFLPPVWIPLWPLHFIPEISFQTREWRRGLCRAIECSELTFIWKKHNSMAQARNWRGEKQEKGWKKTAKILFAIGEKMRENSGKS